MSARRRQKSTLPFLSVPVYVLRSPRFRALSPAACKLLLAVAAEFRGTNNGELEMPFGELVRDWHYRSRHTISRALGELLSADLLVRTQRGRRFGGTPAPSLYALGWHPIPASKRHTMHEISPRLRPQVLNAGAPKALAEPKQVPCMHLQGQKLQNSPTAADETMRVSQVQYDRPQVLWEHLLSRSMPPRVRLWPAQGTKGYETLVKRFCRFEIELGAIASLPAPAGGGLQ